MNLLTIDLPKGLWKSPSLIANVEVQIWKKTFSEEKKRRYHAEPGMRTGV